MKISAAKGPFGRGLSRAAIRATSLDRLQSRANQILAAPPYKTLLLRNLKMLYYALEALKLLSFFLVLMCVECADWEYAEKVVPAVFQQCEPVYLGIMYAGVQAMLLRISM